MCFALGTKAILGTRENWQFKRSSKCKGISTARKEEVNLTRQFFSKLSDLYSRLDCTDAFVIINLKVFYIEFALRAI